VGIAAMFGRAAFTLHVLRSLVIAMRARIAHSDSTTGFRMVSLERRSEVELVRGVASAWGLAPFVPSLRSLQYAVSDSLLGIARLANEEALLGSGGRETRLLSARYLNLDFVPAAISAIERFNDCIGEIDARWAFLFDELELAPLEIFKEVIGSVRSTDERLIFKFALNPVSEAVELLRGALAAMPAQDYDLVRLWYPYKEDSLAFSGRLLEAMLRDRGLDQIDPIILLGQSLTDFGRGDWLERGTSYYSASPAQRVLQGLSKSDPTFRDFLESKNIDLSDMERLDPNERAATLRKLAPIAAVRLTYKTSEEIGGKQNRQRTRSRKNPRLYAGARSLFAIFEGNPRVFIGVMNRLLSNFLDRSGDRKASPLIDRRRQTMEINRVSGLFKAMLRVIKIEGDPSQEPNSGLLSILDRLGEYIHDHVVRRKFTLDPVGTFIVDSGVSPSLERSLREALNSGAIVYIPGSDDPPVLGSLLGCRFRLSYLLAPSYRIPLRLGREVLLSAILQKGKKTTGRYRSEEQEELPYDNK
jgi:hypothetical protein